MIKTTYESVKMDESLPMRVLHLYPESPLLLAENLPVYDLERVHFVPPHWHRSLELTYVVEGGISLRLGDQTELFHQGSFFVVNSGDIHEVSNIPEQRIEVICLLIGEDFVRKCFPKEEHIRFDLQTTTTTYPQLTEIYQEILRLYYGKDPCNYLKIQGELLELFYLLGTYHRVDATGPSLKKHQQTQQFNKDILAYIHCHYETNLTLGTIASHFHFSREHFSRMFKDTFGKTFLNYLVDYRLYRAFPEIVNSDLTIEGISLKHGFPSSKALITQFKKKYQETPLQFRQKNKITILDHNETNHH